MWGLRFWRRAAGLAGQSLVYILLTELRYVNRPARGAEIQARHRIRMVASLPPALPEQPGPPALELTVPHKTVAEPH